MFLPLFQNLQTRLETMCPNRKGRGAEVKGPQSLCWFLHSLTTGNELHFLEGMRYPIS